LAKYCIKCGVQNNDDAVFCIACGTRFDGQEDDLPTLAAPSEAASRTLHTEMVEGEHRHVLWDMVFKDDAGVVVFVTKRPSLLHENFEVFDHGNKMLGRVNRKTRLLKPDAYEITDEIQGVGSVLMFRPGGRGQPPTGWLEDGLGNKLATLEFQGLLSYDLVKPGGSKILGVRLDSGGEGLRQEFRDLMKKRYRVEVFDQSFSGLQVAGIVTALSR
jgi:zinc ribbon protein